MMFVNRISLSTSCSICLPDTSIQSSSRGDSRRHFQSCNTSVRSEDAVAVPQQKTRRTVPGKRLPHLLRRPCRRRMSRHGEMQNPPPVVSENQKYIEDLESESRQHQEIDRDQGLQMILQECSPLLRRRLWSAHHVLADAGFADFDAECEEF